ncbi:MAG TPA: SGNH/GDSL hydrolase family protein, partial [Burkholderiales bacterium]|nr:SGNH/GDSL hydrolase family protein [Burkholderiales bacterium]
PLLAGLFSFLLAASTFAWADARQPQLVIFGDSLSDPGNLFALTQTNNVPTSYDVDQFLVPNSAYAVGGHHLSNGSTWIEDLAKSLGVASNAGPAWRPGASPAANYAVAGARAYDKGQGFDLPDQVSHFLADLGRQDAPSDALYVIEFGGNDIRDALFTGDQTLVGESLKSIFTEVSRLYQAGARKFFVVNVPSIGLLPSVRALEPAFPGISGLGGAADLATQKFNENLAGVVTMLQGSLPGVEIRPFDLYELIKNVSTHPSDFGLADVTTPCITPDIAPYKCRNPDERAFWDGIHPTRALHAIIAQQAGQFLAQ